MNLKGAQTLWGKNVHHPGHAGSPVIPHWLCHEAELSLKDGTRKIKGSLGQIQENQFLKHCIKGVVKVLLLQQGSNTVTAGQRQLIRIFWLGLNRFIWYMQIQIRLNFQYHMTGSTSCCRDRENRSAFQKFNINYWIFMFTQGNEWSEFLSKAVYGSLCFKNNINQSFLFVICMRWKLTSQALLIRHEQQKEERKQSGSLTTSFSFCILRRFIMYHFPTLPTSYFLFSLANESFNSIHMPLINIPAPQPSDYSPLQIFTNSSSQQSLFQKH